MNKDEANVAMQRFTELMTAAEELHDQAAQIDEARKSFSEYLKAVMETNEKMTQVISKCNDYVDAAHDLVDNNLSAKVSELSQTAEATISQCTSQCEKVTSDYKETVTLFSSQKQLFDETQTALVNSVQSKIDEKLARLNDIHTAIEKTAGEIKVSFAEKSHEQDSHLTEIGESIGNQISSGIEKQEDGTNRLFQQGEELLEESKKNTEALVSELHSATEKFATLQADNLNNLTEKFKSLETQLGEIRVAQIKDGVYVKCAAIAACVATIAAIIGLFL